MNGILLVHYGLGMLVALAAALFVWQRNGRRLTLYVLTVQIALGIAVISAGLRAPSSHYALGVVGWAGFMAASAIEKRGSRNVALAVTAASTLAILIAFYLGMHAVNHGS